MPEFTPADLPQLYREREERRTAERTLVGALDKLTALRDEEPDEDVKAVLGIAVRAILEKTEAHVAGSQILNNLIGGVEREAEFEREARTPGTEAHRRKQELENRRKQAIRK